MHYVEKTTIYGRPILSKRRHSQHNTMTISAVIQTHNTEKIHLFSFFFTPIYQLKNKHSKWKKPIIFFRVYTIQNRVADNNLLNSASQCPLLFRLTPPLLLPCRQETILDNIILNSRNFSVHVSAPLFLGGGNCPALYDSRRFLKTHRCHLSMHPLHRFRISSISDVNWRNGEDHPFCVHRLIGSRLWLVPWRHSRWWMASLPRILGIYTGGFSGVFFSAIFPKRRVSSFFVLFCSPSSDRSSGKKIDRTGRWIGQ